MNPKCAPIAGPHLVRYGTAADQKFLIDDILDTYDHLVLNATIVAHMPAALAGFLTRRAKKPFFIDPQTHAFQHNVSHLESIGETTKGKIKRSIRTLINAYGEPIETTVGKDNKSILPKDFAEKKYGARNKEFCKRVLEFQLHTIKAAIKKSDSNKYYEFLKKKGLVKGESKPSVAIAPYFYLTTTTASGWLPVNIRLAQIFRKMVKTIPFGIQVVISRELLINRKAINDLIEAYRHLEPDLFLIWIDEFEEQSASELELKALIHLFDGLGKTAPVVNLYGGYFSVILQNCRIVEHLEGVTHGPEYGEHRSVVPVGGGIPHSKFYLPNMHDRLLFREALRAVQSIRAMGSVVKYLKSVCDCKECKSVIKSDPNVEFAEFGRTKRSPSGRSFPTQKTKSHCARHYMMCKAREYNTPETLENIIDQLKNTEKTFSRILGRERVAHCKTWSTVLSRYKSKA